MDGAEYSNVLICFNWCNLNWRVCNFTLNFFRFVFCPSLCQCVHDDAKTAISKEALWNSYVHANCIDTLAIYTRRGLYQCIE